MENRTASLKLAQKYWEQEIVGKYGSFWKYIDEFDKG